MYSVDMPDIVKNTIEELFTILKAGSDNIADLLTKIEKEALFEAHESMPEKDQASVTALSDVQENLGDEAFYKFIETAASRMLVNYFANHKSRYDERQKEVFLTFLLTNKLNREIERSLNT